MKTAEYKKITVLIGKLSNNLINLGIDYMQEKKQWARIGVILKEIEKDNENLSKALRKASEQTRDEVTKLLNEGRGVKGK